MKKLTLILQLFFYSCIQDFDPNSRFPHDPRLEPFIVEVHEELLARGMDVPIHSIIFCLDSLERPAQGSWQASIRTITVSHHFFNKWIDSDKPEQINVLLAHEMGHAVGLKHVEISNYGLHPLNPILEVVGVEEWYTIDIVYDLISVQYHKLKKDKC